MKQDYATLFVLAVSSLLLTGAVTSCSGPQPLDQAIRRADEAAYAQLLESSAESPREAFYRRRAGELDSDTASVRAADLSLSTTDNPFDARHDAVAVSRGAVIYQNECMACHGRNADGRGPMMPVELSSMDFHRFGMRFAVTVHGGAPKSWFKTIQNGDAHEVEEPGEDSYTIQMPAYGERLAREQIWLLITYMQSLDSDIAKRSDGGGDS